VDEEAIAHAGLQTQREGKKKVTEITVLKIFKQLLAFNLLKHENC
jgi:hypothetical protein